MNCQHELNDRSRSVVVSFFWLLPGNDSRFQFLQHRVWVTHWFCLSTSWFASSFCTHLTQVAQSDSSTGWHRALKRFIYSRYGRITAYDAENIKLNVNTLLTCLNSLCFRCSEEHYIFTVTLCINALDPVHEHNKCAFKVTKMTINRTLFSVLVLLSRQQ